MTHTTQNLSYEQKYIVRKSEAQKLQEQNPHLVPIQSGVSSRIAATKNIRIELKKAFPATKFSITSETFAGGDAIDVGWEDGPTDKAVSEITRKYKAGSFDGMQDLYEYTHSTWTDAFGDAQYVSTHRNYSDAFIQTVLDELKNKYHSIDGVPAPTLQEYKNGNIYHNPWSREVRLALCDK